MKTGTKLFTRYNDPKASWLPIPQKKTAMVITACISAMGMIVLYLAY